MHIINAVKVTKVLRINELLQGQYKEAVPLTTTVAFKTYDDYQYTHNLF